ncbi:hypothetical protein J437_LFUL013348, partial [Ladona fulva]
MGSIVDSSLRVPPCEASLCVVEEVPLVTQLKRFWELEEFTVRVAQNPEEIKCEELFVKTHRRNASGRYIVSLPFRSELPSLGESYSQAAKRFINLERKLLQRPRLKASYCQFLKEYENLGHMSRATLSGVYYLPHHGVHKSTPQGPKLRVVFDTSSRFSNGNSLNDVLLTKLQNDIFDFLLSFRTHLIAFTTDISKIYHDSTHALQEFELNTVTYGVVSAPYLAIRTLHQLVNDEGEKFPLAAQSLLHDTYIDDIVTGADSRRLTLVYPESGIIWKFNPLSAPHFGGLREAGIKSVKYHLPKSSDPGEIDCLTPGHFLVGRPLIGLPEYISNEAMNLPTRWKLIEQLFQHFWRRWSQEYLHTLRQRSKWTRGIGDPKIGDLVLIREPNLPPSLWKMGRIIQFFPDSAGVVRVAQLKTSSGIVTRPAVKLVPLPTL